MANVLERTLTVALTLAAISVAATEVGRAFRPTDIVPENRRSYHVADWRSIIPKATLIGDSASPVTVVVFTDFQCPFCKRFDAALAKAKQAYPGSISTAVVHLPLAGHRQADPAARASECAAREGRFGPAVSLFYEKQDSLGVVPWTDLAGRLGIANKKSFAMCMEDSSIVRRVTMGQEEAKRRGFSSTPTVLVNGWRYGAPPADTELVRAIGDILAGKRPYRGFEKHDLAASTHRWLGLR